MSSILLDFHRGLGDEIICNGMVREFCKTYGAVGVLCLERNYQSVSFMYRDLTNLRIHVIRSHSQGDLFRLLNPFRFWRNCYDEVRYIGNYDSESGIRNERQVYAKFGVPIEKKWESFFVERDAEREGALFRKTSLSGSYIFIHDYAPYLIDPARIISSLPIFRPGKNLTDNIFDYCGIIERADEVHVIDSSFMNLIECLQYTNPTQRLYLHRYARNTEGCNTPVLKKPWVTLV
ncbi:MAG TPA: hypothetical protein VJI70_02975 [Candidatus Paceibacterota bacterium]